MEQTITDDNFFAGLIASLKLYAWVGIAVFVAFALADFNHAIVLTLLLLVILRIYDSLHSTINNRVIDLQCIGLRNTLALALYLKRDDNDLDQAFRDADANHSQHPSQPKPNSWQNALVGFASETIWLGTCGYLGWWIGPALMTALAPFIG